MAFYPFRLDIPAQSDDAPLTLHCPHTLSLLLLALGPDPDPRGETFRDAVAMLAQVLSAFGVG
jgi:hypothetical protein